MDCYFHMEQDMSFKLYIPVYRATLIRTFKTEYQPPTGGTTEQEILKQVPCSFYARTPGERRTLLAMPAL